MWINLFVLLIYISFLNGCCSIIHMGISQEIKVNSTPSGSAVLIDNEYKGNTPVLVLLKRRDVHQILVKKDGYLPYEVFTKRDLSYWIYGNLIFGGALGFLTDAISGSMFNVNPEAIHAELVEEKASIPLDTPEVDLQ